MKLSLLKSIRVGLPETNSSSSHSISLNANAFGPNLDYFALSDDGKSLYISDDKLFGWEFKKYNDPYNKLLYAIACCRDNKKWSELLIKSFKKFTGVDLSWDSKNYPESDGMDIDYIFSDGDTIINFIFNPESWLFTGNDNELEPENFNNVYKKTPVAYATMYFSEIDTIDFPLYKYPYDIKKELSSVICNKLEDIIEFNKDKEKVINPVGNPSSNYRFYDRPDYSIVIDESGNIYGKFFTRQCNSKLSHMVNEIYRGAPFNKERKDMVKKVTEDFFKNLTDYLIFPIKICQEINTSTEII